MLQLVLIPPHEQWEYRNPKTQSTPNMKLSGKHQMRTVYKYSIISPKLSPLISAIWITLVMHSTFHSAIDHVHWETGLTYICIPKQHTLSLVQVHLGQKYYVPQVRPDWGSNS